MPVVHNSFLRGRAIVANYRLRSDNSARRLNLDHLRKQRNRPEYRWSDFSEEQQSILSNLAESNTQVTNPSPQETRDLLQRLMQTLKPNERLIVQWMYLEEKSVSEICDLTGWKTSKIKVTAFRARKKLATAVKRLEK